MYVLCFSVSPLLDSTYKYSESEYAQTLTFKVNSAASFRLISKFILESFHSNFSASLTYPELALKSK